MLARLAWDQRGCAPFSDSSWLIRSQNSPVWLCKPSRAPVVELLLLVSQSVPTALQGRDPALPAPGSSPRAGGCSRASPPWELLQVAKAAAAFGYRGAIR